jgi:NADPH:quinone reductase
MSSIPKTCKALCVPEKGQPLELTEVPVPQPRENEVLIKVTTTALNPHDAMIQRTGYLIPSFPYIPGADIGGTVVSLGLGVDKYAVGDEVFAQINWDAARSGRSLEDLAGLREYAIVDVRCSAKVHDTGGNVDDAITMPTNAVASLWGFIDKTGFGFPLQSAFGKTEQDRKKDGFDASKEDFLVVGGGSQIGRLTVQFAKLMGFKSIVVVAGMGNEETLKKMGATHVVDRKLENAEAIKQIRGIVGNNLKYAFNTVSDDKTIAVGSLSDKLETHLNNVLFADVKDKALAGEKQYRDTLSLGQSMINPEAAHLFWDILPTWMKNGVLTVPIWTIIDGLDAVKAQKVMDKYSAGTAVADHTHIHP